jgi:hypothetical protein
MLPAAPLLRRRATVTFSETEATPAAFDLHLGGSVCLAVASGPAQSFIIGRAECRPGDEEHTPLYPAGETSLPW